MASLQLVPWNSVAIDLSAPAWWRASPARRRSPKNPLALLLHDLISSCLLQCQQAPGELCMVSITHTNYTFILGKKLIKTSVKAISMQSSSHTISFSLDIFVSSDNLQSITLCKINGNAPGELLLINYQRLGYPGQQHHCLLPLQSESK